MYFYGNKERMVLKINTFRAVSLIQLSLLVLSFQSYSQIDSSKNYQQIEFIRFNQANDLFTVWFQSDKDFTDGINVEFAHHIFNNKPANKSLIGFRKSHFKDFSLSINQDIFTPENKFNPQVDSTNRPYTAQLYLNYTKYSNDFWKARKLTSSIYLGVQGPSALGEEMQNGVHRLINNHELLGWDNQMNDGLLLDYKIRLSQMLPISTSFGEVNAFGSLRAGTIYNYGEIGLNLKIGRYTDSYMNISGIFNPKNTYVFTEKDIYEMSKHRKRIIPKKIRKLGLEKQVSYLNKRMRRKLQVYFFTEFSTTYFLRDGSLEGSLIQFSPNLYNYRPTDYEHFVLNGKYGLVFQYDHFYFSFERFLHTQSYQKNGIFGYGRIIFSWIF